MAVIIEVESHAFRPMAIENNFTIKNMVSHLELGRHIAFKTYKTGKYFKAKTTKAIYKTRIDRDGKVVDAYRIQFLDATPNKYTTEYRRSLRLVAGLLT